MSEIALTNRSNGRVADIDCAKMIKAFAQQVVPFCADRGLIVPVVSFYPDATKCPLTSWEIAMVDQPPPNAKGAEAWHTEEGGRPDGLVFAGYLIDNGSQVLRGPNSVASAFSHEGLELARDKHVNLVLEGDITGPDGNKYVRIAAEVCDPCQARLDSYTITNADGTTETVDLSAYVLDAWEDSQAPGPYSSDGSLTAPLLIGVGGYGNVEDAAGNNTNVFGKEVPAHIVRLKAACGRRNGYGTKKTSSLWSLQPADLVSEVP